MKKSNVSFWRKCSLSENLFAVTSLVLRFGFLPPNVSGVGAVGFTSRSLIPLLLTTVGFDLLKGGFYSGFWWTYFGFLGYWLFGRLAGGQLKKKLLFLPLASLLFFLLSNFGVWLHWYPQTWEGLITCYTLALPFYRNTLIGDLVFGWGWVMVSALASLVGKQFNSWPAKVRSFLHQ